MIDDLEKILGIKFADKDLLRQALVHRSYLNEFRDMNESNERLEFLGDSVLSLIVSAELYARFPRFPEGTLTNLRSALVRATTLSRVARKLSLGDFILMSHGEERGGGRSNQSLLANTFEAVLGAIYLDQGLTSAREFIGKTIFPLIAEVEHSEETLDYKSRLQEVTQEKTKTSPVYKVVSAEGPDHNKTFTVEVYLNDQPLATGQGKSKQAAEQQAAKGALKRLSS